MEMIMSHCKFLFNLWYHMVFTGKDIFMINLVLDKQDLAKIGNSHAS